MTGVDSHAKAEQLYQEAEVAFDRAYARIGNMPVGSEDRSRQFDVSRHLFWRAVRRRRVLNSWKDRQSDDVRIGKVDDP